MNKVDQRAEPVPQPGPWSWRACCQGPHGQRPSLLLPALGRAESALGVGSGVWGRGGLAPLVEGPGDPGGVKNTHYLFFGFVKGRQDYGMGLEEPAVRRLPQVQRGPAQFPRPFTLSPRGRLPLPGSERWPGGPGEGSIPVPSLPPLPFQNLIQCFLVWGPGPRESTHLAAAIIVSYPVSTLHHKGFLWSPVPETMVPF